jgi:hypothetical protein
MNRFPWLAALAVAAPLATLAQTKPTTTKTATAATAKPATQEVKETIEELDPATGKVVRRTTRTYTVPAGTAATSSKPATTATTTVATEDAPTPAATTTTAGPSVATDTAVSAFLHEKVVLSRVTAPQLLRLYSEFIDQVRSDRTGWKAADWERAAAVLSSLNARYEQVRTSFSLDDKLTIRSQQGEFQTLRTARQLSDQISNKL